MRRHMLVVAALGLAACGGGGYGGGGGGGGNVGGTLGGAAFTPTDMGALIVSPTSCTVSGQTVYVAAIVIGFGSWANLCGYVQANGLLCVNKANATTSSVIVAKAGLSPQTAVGPGTYQVYSQFQPDANGNFTGVSAGYNKTNGTCALTAQSNGSGGMVTISSTSYGVSGTLNSVTFADGSNLSGSFDAAICNYSLDICGFINNTCTSPACIQ